LNEGPVHQDPPIEVAVVPFGAWRSPLSPADAAAAGGRFGGVAVSGEDVLWIESRPGDDGRATIRTSTGSAAPVEFAPEAVISARSRVNEYGGGAFWVAPVSAEPTVFWVAGETQRITSRRTASGPARPITPIPPAVRAWRHAAGTVTPDGAWVVCERELHVDLDGSVLPEAVNDLVAVRTEVAGSDAAGLQPVVLVGPDDVGGGDFVAAPRLSPDGSVLAWLRWDHPDMPWDAAELWAGRLVAGGATPPRLEGARRVAGGPEGGRARGLDRAVAACLPEWSPDGRLWWCDDTTGWWHLSASSEPGIPEEGSGDTVRPLIPGAAEEVGEPRWISGGRRYGFTDDGRVVFAAMAEGLDSLWLFDPATGERTATPGPRFTSIDQLDVRGHRVAVIAGMSDRPSSVWLLDLAAGSAVDLRGEPIPIDPDWISPAVPISFPTGSDAGGPDAEADGVAHALLYLPRSGDHEAPPGELPPLLVRIHGGPTASARPEFSTSVQFWTTRGFAVVDVNYRGSTGFGRKYRDLLQGTWGLFDVEDCIAAARHLAAEGLVDAGRCVIRGGSAGGFTTLAALCFQQEWGFESTFSAGCSLYGVTDLAALAADTHKFESRYLDGLVGPLPESSEVYRERSPLFHAEQFAQPVLLLQGSEDKIVPPSQAEVLVRALESNGVPHEYVLYPGEGHGFLHEETVINALETELAFYGQVLGFSPSSDPL